MYSIALLAVAYILQVQIAIVTSTDDGQGGNSANCTVPTDLSFTATCRMDQGPPGKPLHALDIMWTGPY